MTAFPTALGLSAVLLAATFVDGHAAGVMPLVTDHLAEKNVHSVRSFCNRCLQYKGRTICLRWENRCRAPKRYVPRS
jgi:hypothetical protein